MIIGDGLMASVFKKDYEDNNKIIIFAAGVSNSFEINENEFKREENLLVEVLLNNSDKHLVYFSSFIDSNIKKRKYAAHKLHMEAIIKNSKNCYSILKLPQVIGYGGNNHILINFIVNRLKNNEEIYVYKNTYKSLIDVEDVKKIVDILLKENIIYVEIPFIEKLQVFEIVNLVAKQLNVEPKIKFIDSGINDFPRQSLIAKTILTDLCIVPKGYTESIIKKYIN